MERTPSLRRTRDGAIVGGVCVAFARHWNVDPLLVRIGVAVLGLLGGLGVALYAGAWLLMPRRGSDTAPIRTLIPFTRNWPQGAIVASVIGLGLAIVVLLGSWSPIGLAPAIVLACVWYFGMYRQRQSTRTANPHPVAPPLPTRPQPPGGTEFEQAAQAWHTRVEEQRRRAAQTESNQEADPQLAAFLAHPDPVGLYSEAPARLPMATGTAARPKRSQRLWLVALVLTGLGYAGLGVLAASGVVINPLAFFATALAAVGLTLVIATWAGRPTGMLFTGIVLAIATGIAMIPAGNQWDVGTQVWRYEVASAIPAESSHDVGEVTLDLTDTKVDADHAATLTLNAGDFVVKLPDDANVVLNWKVQAGSFSAPGTERDGLDLTGTYRTPDQRPGRRTLTLNIVVQAGELRVER